MTTMPSLPPEIYQDAVLLTRDKGLIIDWVKSMPVDRYFLFRVAHMFVESSDSKDLWYMELFKDADPVFLCRVMRHIVPLMKYLYDKGYHVLDNVMCGRPYLMFFYNTCGYLSSQAYDAYKDLILQDYRSAVDKYHSRYFCRMYINDMVRSSTVSNVRWFMDNICDIGYKLYCPRNTVLYKDGLKTMLTYTDKIIHDGYYIASLMECGMYDLAEKCSVDMDISQYPHNMYLAPSNVDELVIAQKLNGMLAFTSLNIVNVVDIIVILSEGKNYVDFMPMIQSVKTWTQREPSTVDLSKLETSWILTNNMLKTKLMPHLYTNPLNVVVNRSRVHNGMRVNRCMGFL